MFKNVAFNETGADVEHTIRWYAPYNKTNKIRNASQLIIEDKIRIVFCVLKAGQRFPFMKRCVQYRVILKGNISTFYKVGRILTYCQLDL